MKCSVVFFWLVRACHISLETRTFVTKVSFKSTKRFRCDATWGKCKKRTVKIEETFNFTLSFRLNNGYYVAPPPFFLFK